MTNFPKLAVLLFLLTQFPLTYTADADSSGASSMLENIHGEWTSKYISYVKDSTTGAEDNQFKTKLTLDWSSAVTENTIVELAPTFSWDDASEVSNQWRVDEKGLQQSAATLRTATITHIGEKVEIAAGKQIFSWGKGELYSPSDTPNPADILDVPDGHKLGITAFSGRYFADRYSLQFLAIPALTPNRSPDLLARWARSTTPLQEAAAAQLGFTPAINITNRILPDDQPKNLQYGIQLTSSEWRSGWDIELSYFNGFDPYGVYLQNLSGSILNLTPVYPEYQQFGAGFSSYWRDFEIHGELSWHDTDDQNQDDDYLAYVIGTRYSLYSPYWAESVDKITYTFEYAGESVQRSKPEDSLFLSTGLGRSLNNTILANVLIEFFSESSLEFTSVVNLDDNDYSLKVGGERRPNDALSYSLSYEIFSGPDDSFFGEWKDNDRAIFSMTYYF